MTGQRRRLAGQVDEDEIVPGLAADALQPHPRAVDAGAVMVVGTAEAGRADQAAVEPVGPGMITADQHRPAFLRLGHELHAAMPADIVEGVDLIVLIADEKDRQPGRDEGQHIAAMGKLRAGRDPHPTLGEEALALGLEDGAIGIGRVGQADRIAGRAIDRLDHGRRQDIGDAHPGTPSVFDESMMP